MGNGFKCLFQGHIDKLPYRESTITSPESQSFDYYPGAIRTELRRLFRVLTKDGAKRWIIWA